MPTSWSPAPAQPEFEPGTLLSRAAAAARHALARRTLRPIATHLVTVEQDGILFLVRVLDGPAGVATVREKAEGASGVAPPGTDPFLPYEADMFVATLSPTHVCLLNKFTVIEHHLLVVTRAFEDQEALLTVADFAALGVCMQENRATHSETR